MSWKKLGNFGTDLLQGFTGKSMERSQQDANTANLGVAREQMAFSSDQAVKANEFSARQAQIQREFETEMSNTSYQRATADMKSAGINPMLAFSQGGASTPSVSAATGHAGSSAGAEIMPVPPRAVTMMSNAKDIIQTYMGIKNSLMMIDKMRAEVPKIKSEKRLTDAHRNIADVDYQMRGMDATRKERAMRWENKHPYAVGLADAMEHRLGLINSALNLFGKGSSMIMNSR